MMAGQMYIPTQEERYAKAPRWALLLCLVLPAAVVMGFYGETRDLFLCATAFLQAPALVAVRCGSSNNAALVMSATLQALFFFVLVRRRGLSPKTKFTVCITWGMALALLLRLALAGWLGG